MATYVYQKPVTSRVTQTFGANPEYYSQFGQKGHNGIDYGSSYGTPVKAVADGTVVFEGWGQNLYLAGSIAGIYCMIRHAKHQSGYAHLSRTVVARGQKVKKGQVIGYTGRTGVATGPHLHFEMYPLAVNTRNGYYGRVDPRPLFKLAVKPTTFNVKAVRTAHVRSAPKVTAPLAGSKKLAPGAIFSAVGTVKGSSVAGNNIWYKSYKGNYVWSGNCKRV
jgi:murein DD-endopeptidase MepM/ murein hydrolase activator NlpD